MISRKIEFKIWQLFPYEFSVLCLGIVVGIYWGSFFNKFVPVLLSIAVVCGGYIIKISWKQLKKDKYAS